MKTLEGLQGRNLEGAVIVEHQTFGREPVHGHIESAAVEGYPDTVFAMRWQSYRKDGRSFDRTTSFPVHKWAFSEGEGGVINLHRLFDNGAGEVFDAPWPNAGLYTIIPKEQH